MTLLCLFVVVLSGCGYSHRYGPRATRNWQAEYRKLESVAFRYRTELRHCQAENARLRQALAGSQQPSALQTLRSNASDQGPSLDPRDYVLESEEIDIRSFPPTNQGYTVGMPEGDDAAAPSDGTSEAPANLQEPAWGPEMPLPYPDNGAPNPNGHPPAGAGAPGLNFGTNASDPTISDEAVAPVSHESPTEPEPRDLLSPDGWQPVPLTED